MSDESEEFISSGVAPNGVPMTKTEFLGELRWLIETIEDDDTMEGSLAYETDGPDGFRVQAALRHGNSMGQGFVRLLRSDV